MALHLRLLGISKWQKSMPFAYPQFRYLRPSKTHDTALNTKICAIFETTYHYFY